MRDINSTTSEIIGAAITVHRELGPGLLESAYQHCMLQELRVRGLSAQQQVPMPLRYKGLQIDCGYRIDLIVASQVVVEIKSVDRLHPIHEAQLLTYLKLTGCEVGLLINFNVPLVRQGIRRLIRSAGHCHPVGCEQ